MEEKTKNFNFALLTYFIIVILFVTLRMLSAFGCFDALGDFASFGFTFLVQVVILLGGAVLLFSAFKKQPYSKTMQYYGFKKISKKVVGLVVLLGVVVFFLNTFVSATFNSFISFLGYEHSSSALPTQYNFYSLLINLIFSALLPGFCEEIVHRGMLLKSMRPLGMWKAIIFSGLLFGLLHLNIEQFFYATIIGVFLGFLTVMTSSIYPAMIVHFMNNALSVYLSFSRVNNLPFGNIYEGFFTLISSNLLLGILLCLLVLILLVYIFAFLCKKIFRSQLKSELNQAAQEVQKELIKRAYLIDIENSKKGDEEKDLEMLDPRLEMIKKLFAMNPEKTEEFRMPRLGGLFLWICIALMGALTLCTFIWGVL